MENLGFDRLCDKHNEFQSLKLWTYIYWSGTDGDKQGADFYDLKTRIYACIYDLKNIKM